MAFQSGTAYPESEVDADDEYERSIHNRSPVHHGGGATDSELSPTSSEGLDESSNEHTPTTYGTHGAGAGGDGLPDSIITEWTADECADFVGSLGLGQYGDAFLGMCSCRSCEVPRGVVSMAGNETA